MSDSRVAAEDRRPRVDHDVVLDVRMTLDALDERTRLGILLEALRAQGHALVELHVLPDDRRLAYNDAGPVINEEPLAGIVGTSMYCVKGESEKNFAWKRSLSENGDSADVFGRAARGSGERA